MTRLTLTLTLTLTLAGCATTAVRPPPEALVPPPGPSAPPVDADGGFTYDAGASLFSRRARGLGDVVTIRVVHSTQAGSKASTTLKRGSESAMGVSALFGLETAIAKIPGGGPSLELGATTTSDFTGEGDTGRAGSVAATLTARVVDVLPDGSLRIWGSQEVRVNNEVEGLVVTGTVDPRAISSDNSVFSHEIADLRIEYAGVGVVSGKQRPGWLTRVLDVASPF